MKMQNGIPAVENSVGILKKLEKVARSNNPTFGDLSKELKSEFWRDISTPVFIAALLQ